MKRIDETRSIDLPFEQRSGPARPHEFDLLSGAEHAMGSRAAHSTADMSPTAAVDTARRKEFDELAPIEAKHTFNLEVAHAEARLLVEKIADLQLKLDCERQARIDAERRLATLKAKMGK